MKHINFLVPLTIVLSCLNISLLAQVKVGINTLTPERTLEVVGASTDYIRLTSSSFVPKDAGIELFRNGQPNARDWKIYNTGSLYVNSSSDNFASDNQTYLAFRNNGRIGMGTIFPDEQLSVIGNEIATNTSDGYLMIGPENGYNLAFDPNTIVARNGNNASDLYIQPHGGITYIGSGYNSNTYFLGGNVNAGGLALNARLTLERSDQYQLLLENDDEEVNGWYIGATNDDWGVGGNQLIFVPNNPGFSSNDAVLRLMDVDDNNGVDAPVIIKSSGGQRLLLDGNEIDAQTSLYVNYNSEENTYINGVEGKVGIGTTSPVGMLHINTTGAALTLDNENIRWNVIPHVNGDILFSNVDHGLVGEISWNGGGTWVALSDRNLKTDITPLDNTMDQIKDIEVRRYVYKDDKNATQDIGVIAQELESLVPEAVFFTEGQYGVSYDQLTAVAIKGIQEQQQRIDDLMQKVDVLLQQEEMSISR